jgi:hypothetical protein
MTKAMVLAATMLAASLGVVAQTNSTPGPDKNNRTAAQAQTPVTITGCLAAARPGGSYVLTEASGMAYSLTGSETSIRQGIGKEVQVSGTLNPRSTISGSPSKSRGTNISDAAARSADGGTIEVSEARVVADECRPVTRLGPVSEGQSSGVRLVPASASEGADAKGSERTPKASAQLPQTSTILPLLGLIGLGSLVAGFFARK